MSMWSLSTATLAMTLDSVTLPTSNHHPAAHLSVASIVKLRIPRRFKEAGVHTAGSSSSAFSPHRLDQSSYSFRCCLPGGINPCLVAHKRAVLVAAIGFEGQLDPVDHNRCTHVSHACVTVRALRQ